MVMQWTVNPPALPRLVRSQDTPPFLQPEIQLTKKLSRTPEIDVNKCIDIAGGNRYAMIIETARRARELAKSNQTSQQYTNAAVSALIELQESNKQV